jgi:hypothetical protein
MASTEPSVYIQIDQNPNCDALDGQVFQPRSKPQEITEVIMLSEAGPQWCQVTGVAEGGATCPALACLIDDSGDGACYLIYGGAWGLRFKRGSAAWDLEDSAQWGEAYLLLPGSAEVR